MLRHIGALLYVKFKTLSKNKSLLLQMISPLILMVFNYQLAGDDLSSNDKFTFLILSLTFCLVMSIGFPITIILAEEHEKKITQTLLLSGIKNSEYLISNIILPIISILCLGLIIPTILSVNITNYMLNYILTLVISGLSITLLYLLAGLLLKTQLQAQVIGSIMMTAIVILVLSPTIGNNILDELAYFSFVGVINKFHSDPTFSFQENFLLYISWGTWIFFLIFLNKMAVSHRKKT